LPGDISVFLPPINLLLTFPIFDITNIFGDLKMGKYPTCWGLFDIIWNSGDTQKMEEGLGRKSDHYLCVRLFVW